MPTTRTKTLSDGTKLNVTFHGQRGKRTPAAEKPLKPGDYIVEKDEGLSGVVRRVSPDGRIVYVQLTGEETLERFSPDELTRKRAGKR